MPFCIILGELIVRRTHLRVDKFEGVSAVEDRKRTIFAVLIALILVVALLYSFGLSLFSKTPQVNLADPSAGDTADPAPVASADGAGIVVEVTPGTVQSVIASMSRYESYSRTVTVMYTWGDQEIGLVNTQVWTDGGWSRTLTSLPGGKSESSICGNGKIWIWHTGGEFDAEQRVFEGNAADSFGDLLQRIPTYEDILLLEPTSITVAEYLMRDGQPCIYVEAEHRDLGYLYRYWISETNGLLMAAETEKSGVIVYKMESNEVVSPMDGDEFIFTLPDGTVLYDPS